MSAGPSIAFLMPTGRCNLDCEGCYATLEHAGRHSAKGELTLQQYEEVVGELVALGVRVFDISGGEPFLYPELPELCELIRSHADTRIWLVTNGTVASREKYASVAGHVERIVFSLDSPEAATHDRLRGPAGAYERTIDAIRLGPSS